MRHLRIVPCVLLGASLDIALASPTGEEGGRAYAPGSWLKVSAPAAPRPASALANTQWRLVEFQSMDDSQGTQRPEAASRYVLRLDADGTATLWLNCNRITGTWIAEPAGKAASATGGGFRFDHFPARVAPCPAPGMDQIMLRQVPNVRSFTLRQGRLHLGLMADGGIYVWSKDTTAGQGNKTEPPTPRAARPEAAAAAAAAPAPASLTPQAPSQPSALKPDWQVTRRVNLREQPSTQSRVLALLPSGTRMQRGECQAAEGREWCRVTVQSGGEGFVAAEYLQPVLANPRR